MGMIKADRNVIDVDEENLLISRIHVLNPVEKTIQTPFLMNPFGTIQHNPYNKLRLGVLAGFKKRLFPHMNSDHPFDRLIEEE